jgi:hypothetical protein
VSSRYIKVSLPDPLAEQLEAQAAAGGERPATLARQLIRQALTESGAQRSAAASQPPLKASPGRARWLEPYGGDPGWRVEMWGQIVALHARYNQYLSHLQHGWWNDEAHTDALCALALWRADLDDQGTEPREELAYLTAIVDFGNLIRQQGSSVTKAWKPDAPPAGWTRR